MHYKSHPSDIDRNNSFAIKVEDLIREIVIQNDIPYYRIESGVERHDNAGASEDTYMPVIRIITYFEDTVNKISHILHDEFDVDIERSVDKKKIRIETFAYKNINYTARLTANRQQQTEYKRAGDKKFEIQICSMLQDAWSGIEKELGYDNTVVPDEAKRDFYRVGALLEMADIEFLKIRTELGQKKQNKNTAPVAQPEPVKAEEPKAPVAEEKSANTFVEHLQAVAKEVQKEAPVVQPEPVVTYAPPPPPVQELPKVIVSAPPPPPAPKPEPKVEFIPPAPVIQQPVAPPAPAVAAQAPVQRPASPIPAVEPIAPQRSAPSAAPEGIAPKPTVIPAEPVSNGIAASTNINIDSLKELAQSINSTDQRNGAVNEVVQPIVPRQEEPKPVAYTPPPVVVEAPKPAPEVIQPIVEKVVNIPPAAPAAPVSNMNVNVSGEIEKNIEQATEKTTPFYNEPAKATKVVQLDENAQMTDATLRDYVMNSKLLKEIDQQIAERAGAKINADIDIEGDVERLRFLKVYNLKQLHDRLTDNKNDIVAFAEKWIGKDNGGSFDSGISLFYLEYLLVGKKNDPAFAVEYVVKFISDNDYSARYIIPTYNSIHNTEAPNFSHLTLKA